MNNNQVEITNGGKGYAIRLNSGCEMPVIGLGTWLANTSGECADAVYHAISSGYRHLDCAQLYDNQIEVGEGIKRAIEGENKICERNELWVTSKIWLTDYERPYVRPAVEKILNELDLEYIDQILMHWPFAHKHQPDNSYMTQENGGPIMDPTVDIKETYHELELLVNEGLIRSIGISNFNYEETLDIYNNCEIKPDVNQLEVSPYFNQGELQQQLNELGIYVVSYRPLGGRIKETTEGTIPINDPTIIEIAEKYNKTTGQICIKWNIQRGNICVPKSTNPGRIESNIDIFDFEISSEDMDIINALGEKNIRLCNPPFRAGGAPAFP